MKKGFTLIELLAVIIILAIIALIATPIILNVIEDSKKSANRSQVELLLGGAEQYYAQGILNDTIFNSTENIYLKIETTNEKPENGNIKIDEEGNVYLAIYLDGVCYTKGFSDKEINEDNSIKDAEECVPYDLNTKYEFAYTGDVQTFTAEKDGYYFMEAWGAQGGSNGEYLGSYGAYTAGYIYLNKGETIYVQVGGQGKVATSFGDLDSYGYNGGEISSFYPEETAGAGSGGATDFRLVGGEWDSSTSLSSRIMVAAGGVGISNWMNPVSNPAPGGGLIGYDGQEYIYPGMNLIYTNAKGATQTESKEAGSGKEEGTVGRFGIGGIPQVDFVDKTWSHGSGGSGGYYGGSGGSYNEGVVGSGSSGSSFISGHTGAVAIKSETDQTPKDGCTTGTTDNNCSIHYSNKKFVETVMIDGKGYTWKNKRDSLTLMPTPDDKEYRKGTGHTGDGYAKIEYVGTVTESVELTNFFEYTGSVQEFTALQSGYYLMESWGAQGGSNGNYLGSYGAYTAGYIYLNKGETIYVQVGGQGKTATTANDVNSRGYNGGGSSNSYVGEVNGSGSGGATDFRLVGGEWNDSSSLSSRIMVAAGGVGNANWLSPASNAAPGGGLIGYDGKNYRTTSATTYPYTNAVGANQNSGGLAGIGFANFPGYNGSFGIGGDALNTNGHGSGGSGGYYGGGSGSYNGGVVGSGSSGTSYISGHTGAVAIKSEADQTPKDGCTTGTTDNNCSIHYSNKKFIETAMVDGKGYSWTNEKEVLTLMPTPDAGEYPKGTGHTGDGYAKIKYIGNNVESINLTKIYEYTGSEQEIVLEAGTYFVTLYGAQGGTARINTNLAAIGGKGATVSGEITLDSSTTLYAYVGGKGGDATTTTGGIAGYNGGGAGAKDSRDDDDSGAGGGATDLRLINGSWNNSEGLNSRIMVAAGGGGGRYENIGAPGGILTPISITGNAGFTYQFGIGQNGTPDSGSGGAGGGGGYFGGRGGNTNGQVGAPGYISSGGTSYASGCEGCKSVTSQTDSTITENNTHYSGLYFNDITMQAGTSNGNTGNGYITILKLN